MKTVDEIVRLFAARGDSEYGGEAVTQLEHALQAALLAEEEDAASELIAAALLHDVGHLLHELDNDAPENGIDDRHENSGDHYLRGLFSPAVTEPVRLHVPAKRFLCAVDDRYLGRLSPPSIVSLGLQGGPMGDDEVESFRRNPHHASAVRVRRWDDQAKIPNHPTPPLEHYVNILRQVALLQKTDEGSSR